MVKYLGLSCLAVACFGITIRPEGGGDHCGMITAFGEIGYGCNLTCADGNDLDCYWSKTCETDKSCSEEFGYKFVQRNSEACSGVDKELTYGREECCTCVDSSYGHDEGDEYDCPAFNESRTNAHYGCMMHTEDCNSKYVNKSMTGEIYTLPCGLYEGLCVELTNCAALASGYNYTIANATNSHNKTTVHARKYSRGAAGFVDTPVEGDAGFETTSKPSTSATPTENPLDTPEVPVADPSTSEPVPSPTLPTQADLPTQTNSPTRAKKSGKSKQKVKIVFKTKAAVTIAGMDKKAAESSAPAFCISLGLPANKCKVLMLVAVAARRRLQGTEGGSWKITYEIVSDTEEVSEKVVKDLQLPSFQTQFAEKLEKDLGIVVVVEVDVASITTEEVEEPIEKPKGFPIMMVAMIGGGVLACCVVLCGGAYCMMYKKKKVNPASSGSSPVAKYAEGHNKASVGSTANVIPVSPMHSSGKA